MGEELTVHVTNIEQAADMVHGFGLKLEHNVNLVIDPGETQTLKIKLTKPGIFPFYCTNFCSALHQEMQGYLHRASGRHRQRGLLERRCCARVTLLA